MHEETPTWSVHMELVHTRVLSHFFCLCLSSHPGCSKFFFSRSLKGPMGTTGKKSEFVCVNNCLPLPLYI